MSYDLAAIFFIFLLVSFSIFLSFLVYHFSFRFLFFFCSFVLLFRAVPVCQSFKIIISGNSSPWSFKEVVCVFKIQTWTIFRSTIFAHYTAAVFSTWADFSSRSLAEKKYLCVFVCVCVCAKQGGRRGEGADIYLPAVVFRLAG